MNVINKIEREQMKTEVPTFGPGDTVNVHSRVVEGGKERIQIFKGLVIGRHGSGINQAFTVARFPAVKASSALSTSTLPRWRKLKC